MMTKIILITGASDGIGKATALALAHMGHQLILHGRNLSKLKEVEKEIRKQTQNSNLDVVVADFLSLTSVKQAAEQIIRKYTYVDVLINNAGAIFEKQRGETEEGLEKTMTLNLFAPMLFTQLLLPLLQKSVQGRIINTTSLSYIAFKPDVNDIELKKKYSVHKAYSVSKLYTIWITRYLAEKLKKEGSKITVNTTHPGVVISNFYHRRDKGFFVNLLYRLAPLIANSMPTAIATGIYLSTNPDVASISGRYFWQKRPRRVYDCRSYSRENAKKVWDYCMKIIHPYL